MNQRHTTSKSHSASGKASSKGTHGARKKTRSDFMIEASCREAENVLLDRRLFIVDNESFEQLEKILSAPLTDNEAILLLMEYKAPWED